MNEVGIFSALLGGLLTFLAPCTFPLIPAYVGFLAGSGATSEQISATLQKKRIIMNALLFVIGFTFVFMCFGLVSGTLGTFLVLHRMLFAQVSGLIVLLFGIAMLGVIPMPAFFKGRSMPSYLTAGRPSSAFFLGLFFGFGWSPCLGPILGTILFLASASGTAAQGAFLLLCYSLGLAFPFLLVAFLYGTAFTYVLALQKYLGRIEKVSGVFLILIGGMLLFGQFGMWNVWADELWRGGWYGKLMDFM